MSIVAKTGLISGLDINGLVQQLSAVEAQAVAKLQGRQQKIQAVQTGLQTLSANLLTLSGGTFQLGLAETFQKFKASSSNTAQVTAVSNGNALPGTYDFQVLRQASSHQTLSAGYASATQALSAATVTIARGGSVATDTPLGQLNGGAGVRRGTIRITDRSGTFADVDLSGAVTLQDVVTTINSTGNISVQASIVDDHLVLADTSGQTTTQLSVAERGGGRAAEDLGIKQSVGSNTLTGGSVFNVTSSFTLAKLNDGNQPKFSGSTSADLRIQLTDVAGSIVDVDLDGSSTLGDIVNKINSATTNAGKVTASIANNRLVITDNTGGGGANPLTLSNQNGANVLAPLGLDTTSVGNVVTGRRLTADPGSVLLRNLRGGQGITQLGQISLTDRAGRTATIDLSAAESLSDVVDAINAAQDGSSVDLGIEATVNSAGNGLRIIDTTGATTSNLIIADVGGSTLATELGLAVNATSSSKDTGSLKLRFINEASLLKNYRPNGVDVRRGAFSLTDSSGTKHTVTVSSTFTKLGEVFDAVNTATGGKVTVELNATGDGFNLVDQAGGSGQLQIAEVNGGGTAADLGLAVGSATTGVDGKSRLASRSALVVSVTATDTLTSLAEKINSAGAGLSAGLINDGSNFSPHRLLVSSRTTGTAGRFVVDDGGLGLGISDRTVGSDAVLRVGSSSSGFLVTSSNNTFSAVLPGLDVTATGVGTGPAQVTVASDTGRVVDLVKNFVNGYNDFVSKTATLTKFDTATNQGGILQGESIVLRVQGVLSELLNDFSLGAPGGDFRSLREVGVTLDGTGKLSLDEAKLTDRLNTNPNGVKAFFTTATTGFGAKLKSAIESLTDGSKGKITLETNSLGDSVDTYSRRITQLNAQLDIRRNRLLLQFANLETVLGRLQAQQSALSKIQSSSG